MPAIPSRQAARPLEGGRASFCRRQSSKSHLDSLRVRFPVHFRWQKRASSDRPRFGTLRRPQSSHRRFEVARRAPKSAAGRSTPRPFNGVDISLSAAAVWLAGNEPRGGSFHWR